MIILSIIGYILLLILVLIAFVILIPYTYYAEAERYEGVKARGIVSWLFGGLKVFILKEQDEEINVRIRFLGLEKSMDTKNGDDKDKKKDDKELKKKEKETKKKKSVRLEYFKKELIKKVLSAVKKLLKHLWPNMVTMRIKAGFDNPMYTGYLCALYSQDYMLPEKYDIRLEPVFDEGILEGEGSIEGRIWLAYILAVALGLVFTKPVRKILFSKK
ncbi:hypothetical protein SAMN02745751_01163 [Dethiosulfatibacter aminovorans DSM 17477]|uniref:DUF2953 domain-containing protein n=1 Tax=Dethiosulfatibacter aminovorans DSM 17477 TaxID=1121476 RepID=A0A1M6EDQ0_9FIRM|nr:DUF2953 domain-containing protein [Dethiosulfatibacter aminovorans]SHI83551.1 hypothetical protein SAMN02745751_01163 [Dethiosulfatibacter aminovorans DSM 17477]